MLVKKPWASALLTVGTVAATLIGVGFFFAIIGVFGLVGVLDFVRQ
jgi:hypothetical protein